MLRATSQRGGSRKRPPQERVEPFGGKTLSTTFHQASMKTHALCGDGGKGGEDRRWGDSPRLSEKKGGLLKIFNVPGPAKKTDQKSIGSTKRTRQEKSISDTKATNRELLSLRSTKKRPVVERRSRNWVMSIPYRLERISAPRQKKIDGGAHRALGKRKLRKVPYSPCPASANGTEKGPLLPT